MALLRAIIRKPAVLLLDEPTSALDQASTLAVETLLTELAAAGTGLVVVSHNEQQAERIATRRAHMTLGVLTEMETVRMKPIDLTAVDLAIASGLVLLSAALSLVLSLRVHRSLIWSAIRMVVQLMLVGYVLRLVFVTMNPWLTVLVAAVMAGAATYEVGARQQQRLTPISHYATGGGATVFATLVITVLALITTLRPDPWYNPREALPLTGIILGNVMNAVSLSLNSFFNSVKRERNAIEARLALGDPRYLALHGLAAQAGVFVPLPLVRISVDNMET